MEHRLWPYHKVDDGRVTVRRLRSNELTSRVRGNFQMPFGSFKIVELRLLVMFGYIRRSDMHLPVIRSTYYRVVVLTADEGYG